MTRCCSMRAAMVSQGMADWVQHSRTAAVRTVARQRRSLTVAH